MDEGSTTPTLTPASPSHLDPAAPLALLARDYLDAILAGERHRAVMAITDAAAEGVGVRDLYLHVFAPVQYEIGRLWEIGDISVATEHYGTAVTQLAVSQLYPYIFAADRRGTTLVATSAAGDLHELGVRMVADFFEMEGWDTHYLGGNTPHDAVVSKVAATGAHLLVVSATLPRHVPSVAELIAALRADARTAGVPTLAGGYPFNRDPDLWREVGADGTAADAEQAVRLGARLVDDRA